MPIVSVPPPPDEENDGAKPQFKDFHRPNVLQQQFPALDLVLKRYIPNPWLNCAHYTLGGALKGFFTYWLPVTLLRRQLKGNFRRAFAASCAVSLVRLCERLSNIYAAKAPNKWNDFRWLIGGFVGSGAAMMIDTSICDSTLMVFWCLIRAVRCHLPAIPHGSTISMLFAAGIILSAYLMDPDELDPIYVKFLNKQTGRDPKMVALLRHVVGASPSSNPSVALYDEPVQKLTLMTPCEFVHPGESCLSDKLRVLPHYLKSSLRVYVPLYAFLFIFSARRNVMQLLMSITKSTLFLSSFGILSWVMLCLMSNLNVPISRTSVGAFMWVAGFSSLFEGEARRKEIAAYSLTYTVASLFNRASNNSLIFSHPFFNWLLIAASCGVMLHNHNQQPSFLMKWLFQIERQKPTHTQADQPQSGSL